MPGYKQSPCKACGAAMIYAISPRGAVLPLDARPVPDEVTALRYVVLYRLEAPLDSVTPQSVAVTQLEYAIAFAADAELRASHFATCPNSSAHSTRRRR